MEKILVTGIAGFIGSQLAAYLIEAGYSVTGIDNLKTGCAANIPKGAKFVNGDCATISTYRDLSLANVDFDVIIHLAGQSSGEISFDDPVQDLSDNCVSTLRLLEYARESSCKKVIFASSMSVYGDVGAQLITEDISGKPLSMYAVGKLASEAYLRLFERYGISSVSLRLFNVYGPGQNMTNLRQGMASIYISQALQNHHIEVKGSPDRFRDLVYIDDVIWIIDQFLHKGFNGSKIVNLCTGVGTKVSELVDLRTKNLRKEEVSVSYIEGTPGDQFGIVGDNKRLLSIVGERKFISVDEGIRRFLVYLKDMNFGELK